MAEPGWATLPAPAPQGSAAERARSPRTPRLSGRCYAEARGAKALGSSRRIGRFEWARPPDDDRQAPGARLIVGDGHLRIDRAVREQAFDRRCVERAHGNGGWIAQLIE